MAGTSSTDINLLSGDLSGNSHSKFGYDSLASGAATFVSKPVQELKENVSEVASIRLFWQDMERRERTRYHQATLILGVLQFALVVIYCVTLEFHHEPSVDSRYLNFIVMEVFIAALAQAIYSVRGICLENSPMLLIANINSIFLAIRIGLTTMMSLQARGLDAFYAAAYAVITVMHVAASYVAWGGEFSRFMSFCIGSDENIQRMFRQYQLLSSVGALDLQLCVMTAGAALFFVETKWWHYVLVSALMFINLALHSLIRRVVRKEEPAALWVIIPYDVVYTIMVIVVLYSNSVLGSMIESSCYNTVTFTVVVMCIARAALFGAIYRCVQNFGVGMIDAFHQQKSSTEFVASISRRYKPKFLGETNSQA